MTNYDNREASCLATSRKIAGSLALFAVLCLSACASNPYRQFYAPNPALTQQGAPHVVPLSPEESMEVVYVDSNETVMKEWLRNRYFWIGVSNFEASMQSDSSLVKFGNSLGATHATYERKYLRTNRGAIPITMMTPTTSYSSGTVSGSYGTANYSGTTYGTNTTTTMMPYSVDRYSHQVMYWAPFQGTPATGVYPRDLSSDETTRFGRNTGAIVYIVANDTPAFYANILAGDLIIQINETPIASAKDYMDYVLSNRGKEVVVLLVRNGETKEVKLRITDEDAVSE